MGQDVRELWEKRELLRVMVERELRIRYKNSAIGFFWSLLNPLMTVLVMTLVFKFFLRNETPGYSAQVLAAYIPYMLFNLAVMDAAQSVIVALPIIRKVHFPRELLPLSAVFANFVHVLLAIAVFLAYLFFTWARTGFEDSPFTWNLLWLPLLLAIQFMLTAGIALIVSALNVFYEDVKYVVGVLLYLLFFLSPIMYFSENVKSALADMAYGDQLFALYHLNPIATLATAYKKVMVEQGPIDVGQGQIMDPLPLDWGQLGVTAALSVLLFVFGFRMFAKMKWRFVERP